MHRVELVGLASIGLVVQLPDVSVLVRPPHLKNEVGWAIRLVPGEAAKDEVHLAKREVKSVRSQREEVEKRERLTSGGAPKHPSSPQGSLSTNIFQPGSAIDGYEK